MEQKTIYLDHAATTKPRKEVVAAMLPYLEECYGNAGSQYSLGVESNRALNQARRVIAASIGAKPEEIYFTSGGTEADNWAIREIAYTNQKKGRHIITSKIEHPAVLHTCKRLQEEGFEVTYLNVDSDGCVKIEELERAVRKDTILISIMYANNEVGTIQPVRKIAQIAHTYNIPFHTDAVQAYGQIPVSVQEDGFDLLSVSGHKCNGPKGVGFLYIRQYMKMSGLLLGGAQEHGLRAGTENIPAIVGLAKASELAMAEMQTRIRQENTLRNWFAQELLSKCPDCIINGPVVDIKQQDGGKLLENTKLCEDRTRLPGNLHISFPKLEAQQILIHLDRKGICAAGGSACTAKDGKPSHVLLAMGKSSEVIKGAIRFSIGYENTQEELRYTAEVLEAYCRETNK